MTKPSPDFRRDINGLRAWAVTVVVLYHFGIAGFTGGFVGVDVFFVISGFLMTGIVVKSLERGDFSLFKFYLARAKRIVPALAALCATLLALGWFLLLPPDYKMLSTHAVYSLLFLSNVEYWKEAGYFDLASHDKWLLHTWSLSVEWQFYLILPIVLWAVWRLRPGRLAQKLTVLLSIALSLGASTLITNTNASTAFFLLHTRAWELLAGGLVFLLVEPATLSLRVRRWIEVLGLLMIVVSVWMFTKETSWPGWRAILPVAGAVLVLAANRSSIWTGNVVAQWLGDRSYSLYLWHWPVYVVLAYTELRHDTLPIIAGLLATLLLGHLSYSWIENSTRAFLGRVRLSYAAGCLALGLAGVSAAGVLVWSQQGVAGRFASDVEQLASASANVNPRKLQCHSSKGVSSPSCVYGGADWRVILLGDSHGDALVSGLANAAGGADAGVVQWTYSACPFVFGLKKTAAAIATASKGFQCSEFIAWAHGRLREVPADIPVVLVGRYAAAAFGSNEDDLGHDTPTVYFSTLYPVTTQPFLDEFARNLTDTACELAKERVVYLVRPTPEMGIDVPRTMSRRRTLGMNTTISLPMNEYRRRNAWVWAAQDAAQARCGVKILDPLPYLCHDGSCYASKDGNPLYYDDDHLSETGNKLLSPMFSEVFKNLKHRPAPGYLPVAAHAH